VAESAPGGLSTPAAPPQSYARFQLIRTLGVGGNGTVYEARELATNLRVALKQLHDHTGAALLRLKQEFRALSELSHPNVVQFLGLFEEQGRFFFTMEFVQGQSLLDHVRPGAGASGFAATERDLTFELSHDSGVRDRKRRPAEAHPGVLDVPRLRSALAQLGSGLIVLHSAGLVHRDVKPPNINVTADGRVVLLDFGLATSMSEAASGEVAGTFAYMAPEQLLGMEIAPAADWYAFGIVVYEALTGRTPYAHQPIRNLLAESRGELLPPSHWVNGLPEDLCRLSVELLSFDARKRPDEASIARALGIDVSTAQANASLRSRQHFQHEAFVARGHELSALRAALGRAREGGSPILWIEGESGIGKSSLLQHFTRDVATDPTVLLLSSRCYEREAVPFRGIDGLIDALARRLSNQLSRGVDLPPLPVHAAYLHAVFPVMQAVPGFEGLGRPALFDVDPQEARLNAFRAIGQLLRSLSQVQTVLLVLDDVHWLDSESASLLLHVMSEQASNLMLVLTSRPVTRNLLSPLVETREDVTRLALNPLSTGESRELIAQLSRQTPLADRDCDRIAETAEGYPLFIQELVVHGAHTARPAATLTAAISARLGALDRGSRNLLCALSVASAPLRHDTARLAAGISSDRYPWVLSALRHENFVSFQALGEDDRVDIYHDRIREIVVHGLRLDERRSTHDGIAHAILATAPDELEALALHFAGAEKERQALSYALAAAERSLQKLGFENAASLFTLALRFETDPTARAQLELRLAQALANSGRGKESADAYLRAAPQLDELSAIEMRRRAGEQLLRSGHVEQGTQILFFMLRKLGLSVPRWDFMILLSLLWALLRIKLRGVTPRARSQPVSGHDRLRLDVCWTVATGLSVVHHLRATEFQARALLLALDAGDTERIVKSSALLGTTLGMAGGPTTKLAGELRVKARELAGRNPSDENAAWLELTDGVASMGDWKFADCEDLCRRAELTLRSRCTGAAWEIVTAQAFGLWSAAFRGNLRAAAARLPELMTSARSRGDRHAETSLILSPLHLVGLGADDAERVRRECERSMSEWPSRLATFQHMCGAYILAQVDLYEARAEQAWTNVSYAWLMLRRGHLSRVQFQRIDLLGLRGRAALCRASSVPVGQRVRWLRRARDDARRLKTEAIPSALGLSALLHGGALDLEGRYEQSRQRLESAAEAFERVGMDLHTTVVRLALAISRGAPSERAAAEERLRQLGVESPSGMLRLWLPGFRGERGEPSF
jgi:eukaryotic-like serine/threonine-protein kinase